ncbi:MAG: septum formation family protein [Nocardioides sp.]|nr:septum formation family protein [Nocardioides sp.]
MREALIGILLAGLLLSGCSSKDAASPAAESSTPSASAVASPPPAPKPPKNGKCYRLSFDEALAPIADDKTVKCRRRHTSQTFKVGRLDQGVEVDSARAQRQAREGCRSRLGRFVGADREALRLSLLATVWFTPTLEEGAAGGRWFRCDVIATAGSNRLMQLPGELEGTLGEFALCTTAEPGRKDSRRVPCSGRHAWRALATVDLAGSSYPSVEKVADAMRETCRSRARSAADDPLDFTWSEERPSRSQWKAGQRYGICWVPE